MRDIPQEIEPPLPTSPHPKNLFPEIDLINHSDSF